MKTYKRSDLEQYLKDDWILDMLNKNITEDEKNIRINQWFMEMDNKRLVYSDIYGEFLKGRKNGVKVLDVGGGVHAFTKVLAENCDYTLLDFCAHGGQEYLDEISKKYKFNTIIDDWYSADFTGERYDVVIANDIFPDVDMRMELFINKILPVCKEVRLLVTYYNDPRFYLTKRVDDTEMLTFLSWDGEITALKLKKYLGRIKDTAEKDLDSMANEKESIYRNGRQVSYIVIKGDL